MSTPTQNDKPSSGLTNLMVNTVMICFFILLIMGGTLILRGQIDSSFENSAPLILEEMATQVDAEAKGLPGDTLVKSVYNERPGLFSDSSVMDVSYNDPETDALKATRSIKAFADYESEVEGTVDDYTISLTTKDFRFSYDSTTEETTAEERE